MQVVDKVIGSILHHGDLLEDNILFLHKVFCSEPGFESYIGQDIQCLRHDHLDAYLQTLMQKWIAWWSIILPANGTAMLRRHYDRILDQNAADAVAVKRLSATQRMDALATALATLRTPCHRDKLAGIAMEEAQAILNGQGSSGR